MEPWYLDPDTVLRPLDLVEVLERQASSRAG
jgi:hypothetical protein